MGISCKERQNRNLTLILAVLLIITNTTCAFALHYLPSDPFNLAFNFALYSSFGALLSVLGLIGVLQRNATLLLIFANQLLLDTLISTPPRILLLLLSFSFPGSFCNSLSATVASLTSTSITTTSSSSSIAERDIGELWSAKSCIRVFWGAEALIILAVLGLTGVQWVCAWRVREHAQWCERREQRAHRERSTSVVVPEKSVDEKV